MPPPLHYRLGHAATPGGHGGNRRALQMLELFSRYGLECEVAHDEFAGGQLTTKIAAVLRGLPPGSGAPVARFCSLRGMRNYGLIRGIAKSLNVSKSSIVIFDSFVCAYSTLFNDIQKRGGKIVVIPQNLDSLSPSFRHPISNFVSPRWLKSEIAALSNADLVCCISREEQWLLSLYGIDALYLPYEPTQENKERLLNIRRLRASQQQDVILILGTASNAPTLEGMRALLRRSRDLLAASQGKQIVVIGYGTEALVPLISDNGAITVLGGVSEEILNAYLVRAKVNLAYQEGATGMLTRTQEMLYCGVPTIANNIAARSYHNVAGVCVVENIDEMLQILTADQFADFGAPKGSEKLELHLVEKIRNLQR